jgi:trans-2-enoyl-CoA reductase
MAETKPPTVEFSLRMLSDAMGKAAEDLRAAREAVERARLDITARNTSVSRAVVTDAERVIDHLRQTDESISDVMKDLQSRE